MLTVKQDCCTTPAPILFSAGIRGPNRFSNSGPALPSFAQISKVLASLASFLNKCMLDAYGRTRFCDTRTGRATKDCKNGKQRA